VRLLGPWTIRGRQLPRTFLDPRKKQELKEAVENLGLIKLSDNLMGSANEFARLVNGTRIQGTRARTLANALIARLGSRSSVMTAAGLVLAAPLIATFALSLPQDISEWKWLNNLSSAILGLASSSSAAIAVAGVWLQKARHGLDQLDQLRSALDTEVAKRAEIERGEFGKGANRGGSCPTSHR
jgi:hypothetical protein